MANRSFDDWAASPTQNATVKANRSFDDWAAEQPEMTIMTQGPHTITQYAAPGYSKNMPPSVIAAGTGAAKGVSAGLSTYVTAGEAWLADNARALMKGNPGMTWDQAVQYTREEMEAQAEANPKSFYGGQIVGAIASPINKVGGFVKGTGTAAAVGRGALTGATYGGISGGAETGTPVGAAIGAFAGGVTGGALSGAARGVQNTADAIASSAIVTKLKDAMALPKQQAAAMLQRYFPELRHLNPANKDELKDILSQGAAYTSRIQRDPSFASHFDLFNGELNPTWGQAFRQTAGQAVTGATAGLTYGLATGQDPVKSALVGAAGGPLIIGGGGIALGRGSSLAPLLQKAATPMAKGQWLAPNADSAYGSFADTVASGARGVSNAVAGAIAPQTLKEANAQLFDLHLFK